MSETMPERYRISPWVTAHGAIGAATMEPHPNGEWVPADLYAALKAENERLRKREICECDCGYCEQGHIYAGLDGNGNPLPPAPKEGGTT